MSIIQRFFYSYFVDRGYEDEFEMAKKADVIEEIKSEVKNYHNHFERLYNTNPTKARLEGEALVALLDSFLPDNTFDKIKWSDLTYEEIEESNKTANVKTDPEFYIPRINAIALYDAIEPRLESLLTEDKSHAQLIIIGQVLEALIDTYYDYETNRVSLATSSNWTDRHLSVTIEGDEVIDQDPDLDSDLDEF